MEDRTEVTQRILNITLEILYLLTGEDYIIVKKPGGRTTSSNRLQVVEGFCRKQNSIFVPPPHSLTSERSEEKILELTKKMMELLTGEVPIRCQDVTVYFSMEEWEYLEGHKDLYKDVMMKDHQKGHKDLYKDVMMDSQPPLTSLDDCENRNTSGDLVTSDSDSEDGMIIDAGPEGIDLYEEDLAPQGLDPYEGDMRLEVMDPYQGDTGPEGLDSYEGDTGVEGIDPYRGDAGPEGIEPCRGDAGPEGIDPCRGDAGPDGIDPCRGDTTTCHVEGFPVRIKEEPLSDEEDSLADNCANQIPYTCVHIKEEPQVYVEVKVPSDGADQVPQAICHIKVETVPVEEDSSPNIYTPRDQGHSTAAHIKEEPVTFINVLDISQHADHIHKQRSNAVAETLAYEVEIPVDKVPAKGPDNASLYSVRQKEDSMEILYHCPSCYKGFSSNLDLARHQVIHTVDKLFICSLCGKSFTEMSFLVKHQVIHTDLKLCVCPVCGGCFYSETSLAKHQKTHSLPLFCSTCGKCFFNKTELAIHERKHSGERPFGCHVCGKHFIAKSVLNKHMLIHGPMDIRK